MISRKGDAAPIPSLLDPPMNSCLIIMDQSMQRISIKTKFI